MVVFIIVLLIVGLIVGAIARLLMPGRDSIGIVGTKASMRMVKFSGPRSTNNFVANSQSFSRKPDMSVSVRTRGTGQSL